METTELKNLAYQDYKMHVRFDDENWKEYENWVDQNTADFLDKNNGDWIAPQDWKNMGLDE